MNEPSILIRDVKADDLPFIVELADQLGYPSKIKEMEPRLRSVMKDAEQKIFVAVHASSLVGWIHVRRRTVLLDDPCVDVGGLIVDREYRGQGIGRLLLEAAEGWARSRGNNQIFIRSNIIREDSHAIYKSLGFECIKTSKVFVKELEGSTE